MSSLRRVYKPEKPGAFSIVFVHGLNGHPEETWMSRPNDETTLWPVWVGEDSGCDTWVLGYDSALSGWRDAAMSLPAQGDNVLDLLDNKPELKGRPLILVGHSQGGLVIKTAVVHAMTQGVERYQELIRHIRGIVFIATPHQGSDLANLAKALGKMLRTNVQVGDMTAHNHHLSTLNRQFVAQLDKLGFRVRIFAETKGVEIGRRVCGLFFGSRVTVVKPGSSDPGVPKEVPISMEADHFSICKPAARNGDQIHDSLLGFVRECPLATASAGTDGPQPAQPAQSLLIAEVLKTPSPSTPGGSPGQLSGHKDSRLRPREGEVLGREKEIAKVLAFLHSSDDSAVVCAQVTGCGGIGKTEVCKAALKAWLEKFPSETVFYVDVPDEASPAELPALIGRALGADSIANLDQLVPRLRSGLYYLDNLESVAEKAEGVKLLRALQQCNGVRLLASSRVDLTGVMLQPIRIDVLPRESAMQLFRKLWAGDNPPPDNDLSQYVLKDLGCHALSITLTARLGHSYSFDELVTRWRNIGVAFAKDGAADSRLDSLSISLRLTRDALSSQAGALSLWTLAALFPEGIEANFVSGFQQAGGWPDEARQALSRHNVWQRRGDRFHLLPPVARFALDEATAGNLDGPWPEVQPLAFNFFTELATLANSVASTEESLRARAQLLGSFDALHRLVLHEQSQGTPDAGAVERLLHELSNLLQFRPVLSAEILRASLPYMKHPALAFERLGDLERRLGHPDEARTLYDRALVLFEREQSGLGQANTLKSLGDLESRLGHPDEARALYDRALVLFEGERDGLGQANTLQSLGDLERRLGHLDEARGLYDRALVLYEREQSGLGQANTLQSLGDLERRLGHLDEARGLYDRGLMLFEREQDGLGQANTLQALGDLERRLGHPDEARALYDRALVLFEHEQDGLGQGNTLKSLGDLESRLNHPDAARALFDRALVLFEREQDGLGQANTLQSLGDLERMVGAFSNALFSYHSALRWYTQIQEPMGEAYTCAEVARCYHALGQKDARDVALKQALLAAQVSDVENVTGYVFAALKDVTGSADAAQAWFKDAFDTDEGREGISD